MPVKRTSGTASRGKSDQRGRPGRPRAGRQGWTFLTNHGHVLLCLARNPAALMRDVAAEVGITERAVQRIVFDLEDAGYLMKDKDGRRNTYQVQPHLPLRHPIERHQQVAALIALIETG
jgi:hypothetical protein